MRRKNEVTLYQGGLIALLVFVCVLAVVVVGQRAKEVKKECKGRLAKERIAIPYYSDDELITRYYQISAELQGALDDLEGARGQATRHELREASKDYNGGGAAGGFAQGFARGFNPGVIEERLTRIKVDTLRQIRALYLAEIARRGLKLPG